MQKLGQLGSSITKKVHKALGPLQPFGGAVDIIVVEQPDGSFKSSPWYVQCGTFQRVLKAKEEAVKISVNGVEANFRMYLVQRGESYFLSEVEGKGGESVLSPPKATKKVASMRTPTSEQLASLNLQEGRNEVTFTFSTPLLGKQKVTPQLPLLHNVDARIYLWKLDTKIVISDVDGTITKSDIRGQLMPLVGVDWSHTGVANFFSAIKERGYQLLFLSARAISQGHQTRSFLASLEQDGKKLPDGPVVISPDGPFPSLFREVIRRAPDEFKIACLEDIKALFPPDRQPFHAGFGNKVTDEKSYIKVGIPKEKIFIINPKGEVTYRESYHSLHDLVHGMFPSTRPQAPATSGLTSEELGEIFTPTKDQVLSKSELR